MRVREHQQSVSRAGLPAVTRSADYNGLNWRIAKTAYMSEVPDGDPFAPIWQKRLMYYSANWQLFEEHIDDDFDDQVGFDANRHMQYIWGMRYIDDIVVRRQDTNLDDTLDKTWYHVTDTLFSTVAILDDAAKLVERVSYDAYGNARHHRLGDLDGDGATTNDDIDAVNVMKPPVYGVGDITRTGEVTSTDEDIVRADLGPAQPFGRISVGSTGTDNILGYAGYVFNAEMHGSGLYTVRHRHDSPELGRWFTRDPIGYVDGMGFYEYVRSQATTFTDAMGLNSTGPLSPCRLKELYPNGYPLGRYFPCAESSRSSDDCVMCAIDTYEREVADCDGSETRYREDCMDRYRRGIQRCRRLYGPQGPPNWTPPSLFDFFPPRFFPLRFAAVQLSLHASGIRFGLHDRWGNHHRCLAREAAARENCENAAPTDEECRQKARERLDTTIDRFIEYWDIDFPWNRPGWRH